MGVNSRALFVASVGLFALLLMQHVAQAATTDEQTTTSNVTVNVYVSISLTTAFSNYVEFGNLDPSQNDQESTTCDNLGCNISVSGDTNVNVDLVMRANANLTRLGGAEYIPNTAYTWNSSDGTSAPVNGWALNVTEYDYANSRKVGDSVSASGVRSWTAWLDIPAAQAAGSYNNTLYFCGNQEDTTDCG